jgi:hypothetical protein
MSHQQRHMGLFPLKAKSFSHMLLKYLSWYLKMIPSYESHVHKLQTIQISEIQMWNENVMGRRR